MDSGPASSRKSSTVPVNITITDVNDNPPYFLEKDYKVTIVDNIPFFPEASPIIQVTAADADIGENGEVYYFLRSGNENDLFRIDNTTGVLYPNGNFQGQKGREFNLEIAVTDGGGEGLWPAPDLAEIRVLVESVNSHKPSWSPPPPRNETVHVVEEEVDNMVRVIKTVHAEDQDGDDNENGRISYFLKVKNENVLETPEFKIDERSGELRTKVTFDRETREHYELVIVARDHGTPVAFETLRFLNVVVDDIDDNKPTFSKTKAKQEDNIVKFTVPEEEDPGYLVGRVKALDPDAGKLGRIFYYILDGNQQGNFRIDRTQGNIYTKVKIDREEEDPPVEIYKLFVKASNDGGLICEPTFCNIDFPNNINEDDSVIEIDITIQDINDNMLTFSNSKYYVGVPYDASVGDLIMDVTAYDPDKENGRVSYSIKTSNLFRQGETVSAGSLVPSPFKMSPGGSRLLLDSLMAEYNQQR